MKLGNEERGIIRAPFPSTTIPVGGPVVAVVVRLGECLAEIRNKLVVPTVVAGSTEKQRFFVAPVRSCLSLHNSPI